jgi:hypothetical protein
MSLILDGTSGLFGNVTGGDISGNFIGLNGNGSSLTATATGSTTSRSLANRFADVVNVKDFGAVGDGVADDTAAFQSANTTGKPIVVPNGNYVISSPITFSSYVEMFPIAKLITNSNLTFNGGFKASISHVFSGSGTISFNASNFEVGYAEWFGAITNDNSQDCTNALEKAHVACPVLQLLSVDYWVNNGVIFGTNNRTIKGVTQNYTSGSPSTRIVSKSASSDIVLVGKSSQPISIPNFAQNITLQNLQVTRSVVPLISSGCKGFSFKFIQYGCFEKLKSTESMVGAYYAGCVQTKANEVDCGRIQIGTGTGDYFQAHFVDSFYDIGTAGGNASLYLDKIKGNCGNTLIDSVGILINSKTTSPWKGYSDLWITQPEIGDTNIGINIIGNGNIGTIVDTGNVDIMIFNPVIDQFSTTAISVSNISKYGVVKIIGGYASPAPTSLTYNACFYVLNSNGQVSWVDGQYVMINRNCYGSYFNGTKGAVSSNVILESPFTGSYLINCTNCTIKDTIINESVAATSLASAVVLSGTTNSIITPMIYGSAIQKRAFGVFADVTSLKNHVSVSGIDGTAIGGKGNAANINGTLVTVAGYYNQNLVDGLF